MVKKIGCVLLNKKFGPQNKHTRPGLAVLEKKNVEKALETQIAPGSNRSRACGPLAGTHFSAKSCVAEAHLSRHRKGCVAEALLSRHRIVI
jgi:hypothetical protein